MKIHAQPEQGKVVVSAVCEGCDNGAHDVLRPCPTCGRSVLEKRNLRAALYGADLALDDVVFFKPGRVA
jgi:hypothetical protein